VGEPISSQKGRMLRLSHGLSQEGEASASFKSSRAGAQSRRDGIPLVRPRDPFPALSCAALWLLHDLLRRASTKVNPEGS
jgi:hypothetical protein